MLSGANIIIILYYDSEKNACVYFYIEFFVVVCRFVYMNCYGELNKAMTFNDMRKYVLNVNNIFIFFISFSILIK